VVAGILLGASQPQETEKKPPSITYPSTRESKAWIKLPDGVSVAVDDGITWKGVTVYLSLTGELVAVDEKSKATLWAKFVGAFWNRITFFEISRGGGRFWAIELRPEPGETEGKDLRQLHDMGSGEIFMSAEEKPTGEKIAPRMHWSGAESRIAKRFAAVVSTQENFERLRERLLGDKSDIGKYHKPDFAKELVLFVSDGDSSNCSGISADSVYRDDKRLLVRLHRQTFQTIGDGVRGRPYGIFILPRKDGEAILFERNVQRYIGGPPIWKEAGKVVRPGDPTKELDGVPAPEPQEKPTLVWNPPEKRILSAKIKAVIVVEDGDRKGSNSFECDSELHPSAETSPDGRVFVLKVNRLHAIQGRGKSDSEVLFERGKEMVLKGDAALESGAFKRTGDDHETVINAQGARQSDLVNDHIALTMSLGLVNTQLAPGTVSTGSTWESEVQVPFQGRDFIGKLKYTVNSMDKQKTAKIGVKAVEKEPDDRYAWEGSGTLVYSFEDSLIREFKFTLKRKDKDGKVLASLEQELTVALKP
jgi:hypothetical protein